MRYSCVMAAAILWLCPLSISAQEIDKQNPILSLNEAIHRALRESPNLKSSNSALIASEGERRQAGFLPNPELSLEAENIAGQGQYKGLDAAELTLGLSQQVEVGGKRSSRIAAANLSVESSRYSYEATQLDMIRDVTVAYYEAIAAREQVKLAKEQEKLAGTIIEQVSRRVDAAAESSIQKSKASVALSTSKIATTQAQSDYSIARKKLATLWGGTDSTFELDDSTFFMAVTPESQTWDETLKTLPDIKQRDAELARAKALYKLEKAAAIPDPTISVGIRDFRETSDQAFVAGVSLPLPIMNRNQGNIAKTQSDINRIQHEKRATELALQNDLSNSEQELVTSYQQVTSLKKEILPAADSAFSLALKGYQAGKFPYLDVLDAQRTLFEARQQYHTALKEYHIKQAVLERLTAKHLPELQQKEEPNVN